MHHGCKAQTRKIVGEGHFQGQPAARAQSTGQSGAGMSSWGQEGSE